jgi:hypothetical protein
MESLMQSGNAQLAAAMGCGDATELGVTRKAGAYTCPLLSSTRAVSDTKYTNPPR